MTSKSSTLQLDPVCGIEIPTTTAYRVTRNGETYCFCGNGCRQLFLRHPSEYLTVESKPRAVPPVAVAPSTRRVTTRPPERRETQWTDYVPLIALVDVALLVACAKQLAYGGDLNGESWMQDFMGLCLVLLAMVKFFDLQAFAEAFRAFDLLARPVRLYAYVYPFLELAVGLAYLARWKPVSANWATLGLMLFGLIGLARALWRGLDVKGASGNVLKVPLSTVAAVEYVGLAAMAAVMLFSTGV